MAGSIGGRGFSYAQRQGSINTSYNPRERIPYITAARGFMKME